MAYYCTFMVEETSGISLLSINNFCFQLLPTVLKGIRLIALNSNASSLFGDELL